MKKIITLVAVLMAIGANAQIQKGTKLLAGSINFLSQSSKYDYTPNLTTRNYSFNLNVTPTYQIFTKDNFAMVYGLNYGFLTTSYSNKNNLGADSYHALGGTMGFKKYTMLSAGLGLYYGMSAGVNLPLTKTQSGHKSYVFNLSLADVGIIYTLNSKFAIEGGGSIGGLSATYGKDDKMVGSDFSFSGNFRMPQINVGLMYFIK